MNRAKVLALSVAVMGMALSACGNSGTAKETGTAAMDVQADGQKGGNGGILQFPFLSPSPNFRMLKAPFP